MSIFESFLGKNVLTLRCMMWPCRFISFVSINRFYNRFYKSATIYRTGLLIIVCEFYNHHQRTDYENDRFYKKTSYAIE